MSTLTGTHWTLDGVLLSAERSLVTPMTIPNTHDLGGDLWTLGGWAFKCKKVLPNTYVTYEYAQPLSCGHLSVERSHSMPMTVPDAHDHGRDPWTWTLSAKRSCPMPLTTPNALGGGHLNAETVKHIT